METVWPKIGKNLLSYTVSSRIILQEQLLQTLTWNHSVSTGNGKLIPILFLDWSHVTRIKRNFLLYIKIHMLTLSVRLVAVFTPIHRRFSAAHLPPPKKKKTRPKFVLLNLQTDSCATQHSKRLKTRACSSFWNGRKVKIPNQFIRYRGEEYRALYLHSPCRPPCGVVLN